MRITYVFVAVVACGGSGTGSVSVNDFSSQLLDAVCTNEANCGAAPDKATCLGANNVKTTALLTAVAEVQAGTVKYDADAAGQCIDAFKNASCTFTGFHNNPSAVCNTVFTGTIAANGACVSDFECAGSGSICTATDSSCDPNTACCPGTCTAGATQGGVGSACTDDSGCTIDLFCETGSGSSGTCMTPATTAGATCDSLSGCADPLYCNIDFASGSSTGTCAQAAASGATCDPNALVACADARQYCDSTSMKCTPLVGVGSACDDTKPCVQFADCGSGSACVARGAAGSACDSSGSGSGAACLDSLECDNSVCTLPADGMACTM